MPLGRGRAWGCERLSSRESGAGASACPTTWGAPGSPARASRGEDPCLGVRVLGRRRALRGLEARAASLSSPGLIKWLRFKMLTPLVQRQPRPQSEFPLPSGKMPSRSVGGKLAPRESRGPAFGRSRTGMRPETAPLSCASLSFTGAPALARDRARLSAGSVCKTRASKFQSPAHVNRCLFLN